MFLWAGIALSVICVPSVKGCLFIFSFIPCDIAYCDSVAYFDFTFLSVNEHVKQRLTQSHDKRIGWT